MKSKYKVGDIVVYGNRYKIGEITKIELIANNSVLIYTIENKCDIVEKEIIFIVEDEKNLEKVEKICEKYRSEKIKSSNKVYMQRNKELDKIKSNIIEKLKQDLIKLEVEKQ
jgi:hypothetical protein